MPDWTSTEAYFDEALMMSPPSHYTNETSSQSVYGTSTCAAGGGQCKPGLLLPLWPPADTSQLPVWERVLRGAIYLALLLYTFWGIAVVSDRFMDAIEKICEASVFS